MSQSSNPVPLALKLTEAQRGHLIFLMSHSFRSRIPKLRTQEVQYSWIEHKMVPKKVSVGWEARLRHKSAHLPEGFV